MKEAAEKEFDTEYFKQTRDINNACHIVGTTIFDQLVGAPRATRENTLVFPLKDNSFDSWVPWGKII
eukprot:10703918-Heterocapsa_arctica.AAC.1